MKATGFEVPERDVDPGEGGHEDRAAAVEAQTVCGLPEVFNVAVKRIYQQMRAPFRKCVWLLGFIAHEAPSQRVETAFHSERMAFECRFTPAIIALFIGYFDEEPTWKDTEVLDCLDLDHFEWWRSERKGK